MKLLALTFYVIMLYVMALLFSSVTLTLRLTLDPRCRSVEIGKAVDVANITSVMFRVTSVLAKHVAVTRGADRRLAVTDLL